MTPSGLWSAICATLPGGDRADPTGRCHTWLPVGRLVREERRAAGGVPEPPQGGERVTGVGRYTYPTSSREALSVRTFHRPGPSGGRVGPGGGSPPQPQLHRDRAHPPRPHPRG